MPNERPPRGQSTSLTRRYNQLDKVTRQAINESFLINIRSTRQNVSVADALREFIHKDSTQTNQRKSSYIGSIFGNRASAAGGRQKTREASREAIRTSVQKQRKDNMRTVTAEGQPPRRGPPLVRSNSRGVNRQSQVNPLGANAQRCPLPQTTYADTKEPFISKIPRVKSATGQKSYSYASDVRAQAIRDLSSQKSQIPTLKQQNTSVHYSPVKPNNRPPTYQTCTDYKQSTEDQPSHSKDQSCDVQ